MHPLPGFDPWLVRVGRIWIAAPRWAALSAPRHARRGRGRGAQPRRNREQSPGRRAAKLARSRRDDGFSPKSRSLSGRGSRRRTSSARPRSSAGRDGGASPGSACALFAPAGVQACQTEWQVDLDRRWPWKRPQRPWVEKDTVGLDNFSIETRGHMSLSDPVLTGPRAGRTVTYGRGSSAEIKLAGGESGGDWAVVEWRVRAGDEPPIHVHTREDETLSVLDGAITAFVGDQRIEVEAGSYAALPKDVPHGLSVRGEEARLLVTHGGNSYYRDDIDRANALVAKGIHYLDVGTSGGIHGLERGFCLMIGGEPELARRLDPIFARTTHRRQPPTGVSHPAPTHSDAAGRSAANGTTDMISAQEPPCQSDGPVVALPSTIAFAAPLDGVAVGRLVFRRGATRVRIRAAEIDDLCSDRLLGPAGGSSSCGGRRRHHREPAHVRRDLGSRGRLGSTSLSIRACRGQSRSTAASATRTSTCVTSRCVTWRSRAGPTTARSCSQGHEAASLSAPAMPP